MGIQHVHVHFRAVEIERLHMLVGASNSTGRSRQELAPLYIVGVPGASLGAASSIHSSHSTPILSTHWSTLASPMPLYVRRWCAQIVRDGVGKSL
jgi:hypothetical protein